MQELIINFADPSVEQVAQFAELFLQTANGRSPGVGAPSASTTTQGNADLRTPPHPTTADDEDPTGKLPSPIFSDA